MGRPLVVMNIAALSKQLLLSGDCPSLEAFCARRTLRSIRPLLPALTLPVQAAYLTGEPPSKNGIVGNGFFDRTWLEHRFWTAAAPARGGVPIWQEPRASGFRCGALFWWNCLGGGLDIYLNVAPVHTASGDTLSSCACDPPDLYLRLEEELGPFPLERFWGPLVSIASSKWILEAASRTLAWEKPDLLYLYLPHMDYSLQRSGPGSGEARQHLRELDSLLAPFLERVQKGELEAAILSEYGIAPVNRFAALNRVLKEAGLFRVRRVRGREYPDLAGSSAFAICDHQVAHVYARRREDLDRAKKILAPLDEVALLLEGEALAEAGLDHDRSGDLVVLAREDAWFPYLWWDDPETAPDYAFTVDIHKKIGYDPLELIFDPARKAIARDPGLIKGSHGVLPSDRSLFPILAIPEGPALLPPEGDLSPLQLKEVVLQLLEACRDPA